MATFSKPTIVPNWGTTTGNIAVPSAGKRNDGWLTNELPASDIENWNKRTTGEWLEWIDERFADGATANELVILSPATAAEMLKLSNAIAKWSSAAGIEWESVAGIFTAGRSVTNGINLKGIGNVKDIEFDGTLNRMSYDVSTDIWSLFNNSATASVIVSETAISLKKPVTLDVNDDVAISGTGRFVHGDQIIPIHASGGRGDGSYNLAKDGVDLDAGEIWAIPVNLPIGAHLSSITYKAFGSGTSNDMSFRLQRGTFTGAGGFGTVNSITDDTTGFFDVTDPLDHVVEAGFLYAIEGVGSSGATADGFFGALLTYDMPTAP